jgi:hypothetical protein
MILDLDNTTAARLFGLLGITLLWGIVHWVTNAARSSVDAVGQPTVKMSQ